MELNITMRGDLSISSLIKWLIDFTVDYLVKFEELTEEGKKSKPIKFSLANTRARKHAHKQALVGVANNQFNGTWCECVVSFVSPTPL